MKEEQAQAQSYPVWAYVLLALWAMHALVWLGALVFWALMLWEAR